MERSRSGSDTHRIVDALLKDDSRELLVITPYLDLFYARVLAKLSSRKRIFILTSRAPVNSAALKELSRYNPWRVLKMAAYLAVLSGILVFLRLYGFAALFLAMVGFALAYAAWKSGTGRRNMHLKVTRGRLVHEKIYISEKGVVTGSSNLTFNGTRRNVEHVDYTDDERKVAELRAHFWKLWRSY